MGSLALAEGTSAKMASPSSPRLASLRERESRRCTVVLVARQKRFAGVKLGQTKPVSRRYMSETMEAAVHCATMSIRCSNSRQALWSALQGPATGTRACARPPARGKQKLGGKKKKKKKKKKS